MPGKGDNLEHVAVWGRQLASKARVAGNEKLARQAFAVSDRAARLRRTQHALTTQAEQLNSILVRLNKSLKGKSLATSASLPSSPGYSVGIAARYQGGQSNAYNVGLTGRRIGRGPVRMTAEIASSAQSTKLMSTMFRKILEVQSQLTQLRTEVERLRQRK